jgi:hypothetical protein
MKDLRRQPAFRAGIFFHAQKGAECRLCRPEHTRTKEKFIASVSASVNVGADFDFWTLTLV